MASVPVRVMAAIRRLPLLGPLAVGLSLVGRVILGGQGRSIALLRLRRSGNLFQPFAATQMDRYPEVFAFVRDAIGDSPQRRLLSFGCSTGEEVFSLRRYFPSAQITGIDINPYNIATCKAQAADDAGLQFILGSTAAVAPGAPFDAVFAMSVLLDGRLVHQPASCAGYIDFADFERTVADLTASLRPGGLFAIAYACFCFTDTAAAAGFERVLPLSWPEPTPIYGRNNQLMPGRIGDDGVYRKAAR